MYLNLLDIRKIDVPAGKVVIFWLGASGFVFKFANGKIVCIDPYLSDFVEREFGFRRLTIPPVAANELKFDYLLITHAHGDHLDADSFDELIAGNPGCKVIAPIDCEDFLKNKKSDYTIISSGETIDTHGMEIHVVDADHGSECSDAVGYLLKFDKRSIYFTGDTGYNKEMMADIISSKPDIVIPCINGAYGNLDPDDASDLVAECDAEYTVPSHFWLFAEHGIGSPGEFRDLVNKKSPKTNVALLTPGRGIEF
jgi:L-ascorbate 6-phosphate lactonase